VGNYSRNIVFATEDTNTVAREHRGHVMFMHNADVDVRFAEFHQLGRTSKDLESFEADDVSPMLTDSNVFACPMVKPADKPVLALLIYLWQ